MVWKDLKIYRKTTKSYELRFRKNGIAIDITNYTIYFSVKENMKDSDEDAKIFKVITSHLDAKNGKTLIELSKGDTDLRGSYYYSMDYKNLSNEDVLFCGRIKFSETVIKSRT